MRYLWERMLPGGRGHWHTDHDHETKEVRGILCNMCNVMLGHCSDSIARLESAIDYLRNPPARTMLAGRAAPTEGAYRTSVLRLGIGSSYCSTLNT